MYQYSIQSCISFVIRDKNKYHLKIKKKLLTKVELKSLSQCFPTFDSHRKAIFSVQLCMTGMLQFEEYSVSNSW